MSVLASTVHTRRKWRRIKSASNCWRIQLRKSWRNWQGPPSSPKWRKFFMSCFQNQWQFIPGAVIGHGFLSRWAPAFVHMQNRSKIASFLWPRVFSVVLHALLAPTLTELVTIIPNKIFMDLTNIYLRVDWILPKHVNIWVLTILGCHRLYLANLCHILRSVIKCIFFLLGAAHLSWIFDQVWRRCVSCFGELQGLRLRQIYLCNYRCTSATWNCFSNLASQKVN